MGKLRRTSTLVSVALACALAAAPARAGEGEPARADAALPILFGANRGQWSEAVLYQARVPGLVVSLLADGLHLDTDAGPLRLRFVGADARARAEGCDPRAARVHFLGGERAARAVPTYGRVLLRGLYPGIDLEIGERDGRLEYDVFLGPEAEEGALALELEGADDVAIDADGALCAALGGAVFRQLAPLAWQTGPEGREPIACAWRALTDGRFGFELGARRRGAEVCIDPVLVYSSYVGGSNADAASAVFVDEDGAAYVTGWARSTDFPGALAPAGERREEVVVFKLGPDGRELEYATYIGGRGDDRGLAIAVTDDGAAVVAGTTHGHGFPSTADIHAREPAGGSDVFVLKLTADGAGLAFATFLGGAGDDVLAGLALGVGDEITLAGTTRSRDFPVSSWAHSVEPRGGRDVFVARLEPDGARLLYSTLLGGSDDDEARAVALDDEGCAYVTGRTRSHDFPTTLGALDRERRGVDAFVAKLSGGGRTLLYSTLLGGSQQDEALAIAVDEAHRAVVAGWTQSLDFPFDAGAPPGRKDAFVVRLSEMGNGLVHATALGGDGADEALGLALDPEGSAWVVGRTRSHDLPVTADAQRQKLAGAADAFLARIEPARGTVVYLSYLGGGGEDELCAVASDRAGRNLALCGVSSGIPMEQRGPLAGKYRGPSDAFVVRFDPRATGPVTGALRSGIGLGF